MPPRRPPSFSLAEALRRPDFTPRGTDLPELIALLASTDEEVAKSAERAIASLGEGAVQVVLSRLREALPPLRGRLAATLGRIAVAAPSDALRESVVALLGDPDAKTRRNAIIALGKLPGPGVENALLSAWAACPSIEHRRSLAASLGKVGGERALAVLATISTDDAELRRLADRALLMLSRSTSRTTVSGINAKAAAPSARDIAFSCRAGLERILVGELAADFTPRVAGPGRVLATLSGPLARVFTARTWIDVGFPLPPAQGEVAPAVAAALASPTARAIFSAYTAGPIRYRLHWAEGGHRRALVWRCAQAIAAVCPTLVNDPTESTWEVLVEERGAAVGVTLSPLRLDDPRFAYRVGDVPAASHPTIAAALARVAGAKKNDVVWDPFVGSGTELIERARLGPYQSLHGSDREPAALAITRQNLAAAGITDVALTCADATSQVVPGVTLILTNPPMGRRIRSDLGALLDRFIDHAAQVLVPGGRLVWLSPQPRRTAERAARRGLALGFHTDVDMGGFKAQLQVLRRAGQVPALDEPAHRS